MNYLTLDEIDCETYFDVKAAILGEDERDRAIAFTHNADLAVAVTSVMYRAEAEAVESVAVHASGWWRIIGNCGCGDTCPHADGEHDDCAYWGLPPCRTETFSWRLEECAESDAGALAATILEVWE